MSKPHNARKAAPRRLAPPKAGKASSYIEKSEIYPGLRVVLVTRVSTGPQDRHNNPLDQENNLWRIVDESGGRVVGSFTECGPGTETAWLGKAAAHAENQDAVLLAETVCRFIRPAAYNSKTCPDAQATEADLKRLRQTCGDVRLMTDLYPDASPGEVRTYHTLRGQQEKGRKGGRPPVRKAGYKKAERSRRMSEVLECFWAGHSRRQIAEILQLQTTQVQRDIDSFRRGVRCSHFFCDKEWLRVNFPEK